MRAAFGLSGDGRTAVIEMAAASGLTLLSPEEQNPLKTSTRGSGELIRHALDAGATTIVIGIGGSATVDGGIGMARALGVRFLDARGREIGEGGGALSRLAQIDMAGLDVRLAQTAIRCACDVNNPLTGPRGAAQVFGPQKGASPAMVKRLDANLRQLARIIHKDLGLSVAAQPGAGAAGGLGAGLLAFVGAEMCSGVDLVMQATDFSSRIADCDLVITGEGRMDRQTAYGKAPAGVARAAGALGIPVIALCGCVERGFSAVHAEGIGGVMPAAGFSFADEGEGARPRQLRDCAEQTLRLLALGMRLA